MNVTYPPKEERLFLHRNCQPTPYQKGFEDYRYSRVYRNPYALHSAAWAAYVLGNEDARAEARREKL